MSFDKKRYEQVSKTFDNNPKLGQTINTKVVFDAVVISIDDPDGLGRIKVRIKEGTMDNDIPDKDLPYCYPLIDKILFNEPRVGEGVRIILSDLQHPFNSRFYVSRLVPQINDIKGVDYVFGSVISDKKLMKPKVNMKNLSTTKGLVPEREDVGIIGKNNSDIFLKDHIVELRSGKHKVNKPLEVNEENPAKVHLNYDKKEKLSTNVLLSDQNFILSYKGKENYSPKIDEETIKKMKETALSLPYGELLVEFLEIFRLAFLTHVHPYSNMPPVSKIDIIEKLQNFNLESILSKNNKIN